MKKKRILLASILKPINDTRMFEKLGLSLSKLVRAEIHICGFNSKIPSVSPNIYFHPLFSFSRLSSQRLFVSFKFLRLLFRIKPQVLIICTPELLLASLVYKSFNTCNLVYDIQENYKLNINTQSVYPGIVKNLLAGIVRSVETITANWVHTFFLAERSYLPDMPFIKNNYLLLENKYQALDNYSASNPDSNNKSDPENIKLLYSGTISELYGIFEAVNFTTALYEVDNRISLIIIGCCQDLNILQKLKQEIAYKPYINLIGGQHLVPHYQIIEEIKKADFGLLPYNLHLSLAQCMPTKLFEYIANSLPVIIQDNLYWHKLVSDWEAGIFLDFKNFQASETIKKMSSNRFYTKPGMPDVYWESEEKNLLNWAKSTISRS